MCSVIAAVAVISLVYTVRTQQQKQEYDEGVANYNARVAENDAQKTRKAGVEAENIQRRKTAELLSKQRAQLGASNVELTSGSALQLQEDTISLGEADALRIRSNFEEKASSLEAFAESSRQPGSRSVFSRFESSLKRGGRGLDERRSTFRTASTGVSDKWYTSDSAANN